MVEFGSDTSFSYNLTTNPQLNFLLCLTVCCENGCGCCVLAAAHLPVVSCSLGLVTVGSPQHPLRFTHFAGFPVTLSLPLEHHKKR